MIGDPGSRLSMLVHPITRFMLGRPLVRPSVATASVCVVAEPLPDLGQAAKSLIGSWHWWDEAVIRSRLPRQVHPSTHSMRGRPSMRPSAATAYRDVIAELLPGPGWLTTSLILCRH